jgi:hypothetical protein
MKTQRRHFGALEFINDILLARARLAQAKSDLAVAQARAKTVKRGGRAAAPVAPLVQRQVRHAEMEFIRAKAILAKIEKKYLTVIQSTVPKREAPGHQPASAPARRLAASAVRVLKEKKPAAAFRGLPLARSAPAALLKKPPSPNPIRPVKL